MILKGIEFLRKHMRALKIVLILYLFGVVIFDFFLHRHEEHVHFWFDKFLDYWTLFTIVGCFLLIKVGKGIAHTFLGKDEDFYG